MSFSEAKKDAQIAISVDMMDTGMCAGSAEFGIL